MALPDLKKLADEIVARYKATFNFEDCAIPSAFKQRVTKFNTNDMITYSDATMKIDASTNLLIIVPNQWLYIAAYFVEYYKAIVLYREKILSVANTKELREKIKLCVNNENLAREIIDLSSYEDEEKEQLILFLTDYNWWHGGKTIDRNDFYVSPILSLAGLVNASQSYVAEICKNLAQDNLAVEILMNPERFNSENLVIGRSFATTDFPLQSIYYGAPGTGKSHTIKEQTAERSVVRTTFHPDSDYSTFVGAYKPTTIKVQMRDVSGHKIVENGEPVMEDRIIYEFVHQAFLTAYIKAWKTYAKVQNVEEQPEPQFLVIEEINRGNCAQIFGDLFQLLDRGEAGFSDYPIHADNDMRKQLKRAFEGLTIPAAETINALYQEEKDVVERVLNGELLLLPNNLYIWATMNTSDQSLFPIDSAFKRRWDWQYVPISQGRDKQEKVLQWRIAADTNEYDWWSFLTKVNDCIADVTQSEDKKLGYFFCKADKDGVISTDNFVSKVLFYLWNDVFKDYDSSVSIFKDAEKNAINFDQLYRVNESGHVEVCKDKVEQILQALDVMVAGSVTVSPMEADEEEHIDTPEGQSKAGLAHLDFWKRFKMASAQRNGVIKATQTPATDNWYNIALGKTGVTLCCKHNYQQNWVSAEIWFDKAGLGFFSAFEAKKSDIEAQLPFSVEWREGQTTRMITAEKGNFDLNSSEDINAAIDWLFGKLEPLYQVATKVLQSI